MDKDFPLTPFLVGGIALVIAGIYWVDYKVPEEYKRPVKGQAPRKKQSSKKYTIDTRGNWRIEWLGVGGKLIHKEIDRGQTLRDATYLANGGLLSQGTEGGSIPVDGRPKATRWQIVDLSTGDVAVSGNTKTQRPQLS